MARTQINDLPDEVVVAILSFIETSDIIRLQSVNRRFLALGRDNTLWKLECFKDSRAEAIRRRQQLLEVQDSRLAELRDAVSALPGADTSAPERTSATESHEGEALRDPAAEAQRQRNRALANWEPGYPGERVDYYEEYIHRHAPMRTASLALPKLDYEGESLEATGVGCLTDLGSGQPEHVVAPLDDGRLCIWDISARTASAFGGGGKLIAQSSPGLLTGHDGAVDSRNLMLETHAVDRVAIDSATRKAYFAVHNLLQEIDLNTMQLASSKQYPFSITALSEARNHIPVTVGTNMTIHLHDPRDRAFAATDGSTTGELIGGSEYSHATLAQPGPLSILNHPGFASDDSSIWVAGRFTSLLNYDRRYFPRLRGTIHSGARIASLSSLPYPLIPQSLDLIRNPSIPISALQTARAEPGTTILAAAEYKGKGSLELYGLPHSPHPYQNRQTASSSRLFSVAPHGGRIVFSDGDGNLKWVERDGCTHTRSFNINVTASNRDPAEPRRREGEPPLQEDAAPVPEDIVQKIVPTSDQGCWSQQTSSRRDVNQANLLLWTGDGKLSVLGYGRGSPLDGGGEGEEEWHDAVEAQAESVEKQAREDAQRQYGRAMRRALERNADEVRFVRGLGMG